MNTEAQSGTSELHRRRTYDQACPVAHSMDLLGERWTLLIVRDLMFGPLRFGELREGLPGLSPNLLSTRLADLTSHGLIERFEDPAPGRRHSYRLTPRGRELAPVVHSLARFGAGEWPDPATDPPPPRLLRGALLALMDPAALDDSGWSADLLLDGGGHPGGLTRTWPPRRTRPPPPRPSRPWDGHP
ncbi:MAG: helix-turn-helix domain-containing protein [Microthrixaceae bacterium]